MRTTIGTHRYRFDLCFCRTYGGCHRKRHTRRRRMLELCLRAPASCRGDFYRRVLQCNGDRDARVVRASWFDFLEEFDVFAPLAGGEHRSSPPALFRAFLAATTTRTSTASVQSRENSQNTVVWLSCGFDRPPSRDAVDRFLTDLEHVVDGSSTASSSRPPAAACSTLTYHRFHRREDDARRPRRVERLRSNRRRVLPRLRLYDRLDRAKIPIAAEFTASKRQRRRRCASRVTRSPSRSGCLETAPTTRSAGDHLLAAGSCQSLRYNARNTDDRKTSSTGSKPASTNTAGTFS